MDENQTPKITVREVTGEEKSRAEVEEVLLKKHEEKHNVEESKTDVERVDTSTESSTPENK